MPAADAAAALPLGGPHEEMAPSVAAPWKQARMQPARRGAGTKRG